MSYLNAPRIHFAGRFQADTSTVNNDVRHYDVDRFRPDFQRPMEVAGHGLDEKIERFNGYWNPEGTGAWRMLGCEVTGAVGVGGPCADPVVGARLVGADDRVAAKLVDLDPQQQLVSEIWGLAVRLVTPAGEPLLASEFLVAPLYDLWQRQRQPTHAFDQTLAAAFQSELVDVDWSGSSRSPVLAAMRAASAEGRLSMRMNVFGFDRTPGAQDYGTGVVVGTIGPAAADGPRRFVRGRQLVAAMQNTFAAANDLGHAQAVVDRGRGCLSLDLGNALPVEGSSGELVDLGRLLVAALRHESTVQGQRLSADDLVPLGEVPYRDPGWYRRSAGVVDLALDAPAAVAATPLAVVRDEGDGTFTVLVRETGGGLYVRADHFVRRLDAGASTTVDLWASRYGEPLEAELTVTPTTANTDLLGGPGTGADLPPEWKVPDVRVPAGVLRHERRLRTDATGLARLTIHADRAGPGNPRGTIDGQLYGLACALAELPAWYVTNVLAYVSVLAFDAFEPPEHPTWFRDVRPILRQYGNLYPIMSGRFLALDDYDSVVAHRDLLRMVFRLPLGDPNSMPTSRDLSAGKRACLLRWLDSRDPDTGLPPEGSPPSARGGSVAATGPAERLHGARDAGAKQGFVRALRAHRGEGSR